MSMKFLALFLSLSVENMNVSLLILVFNVAFPLVKPETVKCTVPFECSNMTFQLNEDGDSVQGLGYKSNYGDNSWIESRNTMIQGAYAAQYSETIIGLNYIGCGGVKSCSSIDPIVSHFAELECLATSACSDSTIDFNYNYNDNDDGSILGLSNCW